MILCLLLCLALTGAPEVGAQENAVLELPTVTLVGEDTLYLQPPSPTFSRELSLVQLTLRRRALRENPVPGLPPAPELSVWLERSTSTGGPRLPAGAPGERPDRAGPLAEAGAGQPGLWEQVPLEPGTASAGAWSFLAYYLPARLLRSQLRTVHRAGPWETVAELDLGLADGWVSLSPGVPTFLWGRFEGGIRAPVRLRVSALAGAFLPLVPVAQEPVLRYVLSLTEDLVVPLGPLSLIHETDAAGLSPAGDPARVGLVGQRLAVEAFPGDFVIHAEAAAYLRGTLEPDSGGIEGLVRAAAGYRAPRGRVALGAGASGLYREQELRLYPEAGLELAPWEALRIRLGAAAFLAGTGAPATRSLAPLLSGWLAPPAGGVLPPPLPMGLLHEGGTFATPEVHMLGAQAVEAGGGVPALRPQSGYSLRAAVLLAARDRLRAEATGELLSGWVYEGWGGVFAFREVSKLAASAELSAWLLRFGTTGGGLQAAARVSAAAALPTGTGPEAWPLDALYGERLEGEVRLAFPNLPLRFIMGALWGEIPAGPPAAALPSPWEPFRGLAVSLSGDLALSRRHTIRAGVEVRMPEAEAAPGLRFLAAYRYRGP